VSRGTHGPRQSQLGVAYGTLTRSGRPFQQRSAAQLVCALCPGPAAPAPGPYNPVRASAAACTTRTVWAPPVSLAATPGMLSLPRGTEMFQFPRFPRLGYVFTQPSSGITPTGLPHSDTLGSQPARGSPRRFVAWPRPSSAPDAKASTVCSTCGSSGIPGPHPVNDVSAPDDARHGLAANPPLAEAGLVLRLRCVFFVLASLTC
jgi:hypothetical protein